MSPSVVRLNDNKTVVNSCIHQRVSEVIFHETRRKPTVGGAVNFICETGVSSLTARDISALSNDGWMLYYNWITRQCSALLPFTIMESSVQYASPVMLTYILCPTKSKETKTVVL